MDGNSNASINIAPRTKSTTVSPKASNTNIRKSLSSPTTDPTTIRRTMKPEHSEPTRRRSSNKISVTPTPKPTSKRRGSKAPPEKDASPTMVKSPSTLKVQAPGDRANGRSATSSRFSKNLFPAWLAKSHSNTTISTIKTSPSMASINATNETPNTTTLNKSNEISPSSSVVSFASTVESAANGDADLSETFETLLDELNMTDSHREKLRKLPLDRKLYLLQQNNHVKGSKTCQNISRKSMTASNSSISLHQPKSTKHKSSIKKSETSSRITRSLLSSSKSLNESNYNLNNTEHVDSLPEIPSKEKTKQETAQNQEKTSDDDTLLEGSKTISSRAEVKDGRAAAYKFARKNLSNFDSTRSKVGSMVLEFDALAYKQEDPAADESSAWLLLDNKSLSHMPTKSTTHQRPSLNNLFTKVNTESVSSTLISNSYAYQSLTRRDASHMATLVSAEDNSKRGKDRDSSPYFYVEKLRNR
ncbi:hypothetical protein G6F56_009601 [Rhizopus delemar]|nr:hypothetical protein G6F56_009601 [Rhizopus delemar]